jgi:hypothetical protein
LFGVSSPHQFRNELRPHFFSPAASLTPAGRALQSPSEVEEVLDFWAVQCPGRVHSHDPNAYPRHMVATLPYPRERLEVGQRVAVEPQVAFRTLPRSPIGTPELTESGRLADPQLERLLNRPRGNRTGAADELVLREGDAMTRRAGPRRQMSLRPPGGGWRATATMIRSPSDTIPEFDPATEWPSR